MKILTSLLIPYDRKAFMNEEIRAAFENWENCKLVHKTLLLVYDFLEFLGEDGKGHQKYAALKINSTKSGMG